MKTYIGTKLINAKPMTRQAYNDFRGWELPANENGADEGFLVEYVDGGKANTEEYAGYVSWSPADVFERAYRSSGEMTFGDALERMKAGAKMARKGWNGKGMWIAISSGNPELEAHCFWNPHAKQHATDNGGYAPVLDTVIMRTADGSILMGWLASQSDMLANDWEEIE